jgi:hypothetical protein
MAKLIRPRLGPVQELQGVNPGVYLREGQEIQRASRAISGLANDAMNMFQQQEQDDATTEASLEFSNWHNEIDPDGTGYVSTERALELGAEDNNKLYRTEDGEQTEREDIPLWQIMPEITQKKYNQIIEDKSAGISGGGNRSEWLNRRREQGQKIYDDLEKEQRVQMFKHRVQKSEDAIEAAHMAQDHALAISLASAYPIPEEREKMVKEAKFRAETDTYHNIMQTQDPAQMLAAADEIKSDSYSGALSEAQQTAWVQQLTNMAKVHTATASKERSLELDRALSNIENGIGQGIYGQADLDRFHQGLSDAGRLDYVPKGWYSDQQKRILETQNTLLEEQRREENVIRAMSGLSVVDPEDADDVEAVNRVAESLIITAGEDPEEAQNRLVTLAGTTGVLPDILRTTFLTAGNSEIPADQVALAARMYNRIYTEAPNVLGDVPQKSRLFLEQVYQYGRGGQIPQEAIQSIRDNMALNTPDVIKMRTERADKLLTETGEMGSWFEDRITKDRRYEGFFQLIENTTTSDSMRLDFESKFRQYMVMGADSPEVAAEAAYNDMSASYQRSEVNGKKEIMRDAPEARYNLTTKQIRTDLNNQLMEDFGLSAEEAGGMIIKPHPQTQFEKKPTYQVYSVDEYGMLHPQRDQYGQYVRFRPDVESIKKERDVAAKQEAIEKRERLKEFERNNRIGGSQAPDPSEQEPESGVERLGDMGMVAQ